MYFISLLQLLTTLTVKVRSITRCIIDRNIDLCCYSRCKNRIIFFTENYNRLFLRSAAVIIILFSFIRICIEIIQVCYRKKAYFYALDNWVEACLFTSSIVFVSYGLQSGCQCPASWHWQFGAFTLLIAWLDLVLFLKNFPQTGVYVLMFIDILHTFLKMFLISTLFVISFGLTFYMLFHRPVS